MQTEIFEHKGVLIQLTFSVGEDGRRDYKSARGLGADYRPEGPDLLPLLADCATMVGPDEMDWVLNQAATADRPEFESTTI